jgi:hypothetical protein
MRALPPADSVNEDERTVDAAVSSYGLVQFVCRRVTARKRKSRSYFWTAESGVVGVDRYWTGSLMLYVGQLAECREAA